VEAAEGADDKRKPVTRPRPAMADLAGAIKYDSMTRATFWSAPAPANGGARAVGALAKALLANSASRC